MDDQPNTQPATLPLWGILGLCVVAGAVGATLGLKLAYALRLSPAWAWGIILAVLWLLWWLEETPH